MPEPKPKVIPELNNPGTRLSYSGYPVYGTRSYPGTDEFHRELTGTLGDRKYREMLSNHALTATAFTLIISLCKGARWSLAPANETPEAIAAHAAVEAAWNAMSTPWRSVLAEMLTALPLGWSWHEVVYRAQGSRIVGLEGLYFVRQDSRLDWRYNADGRTLEALDQLTRAGQSATIPLAKSVHFVPDTTFQSPEGNPWLRSMYVDYRDQQMVKTDMLIGTHKDATGMLTVYIPVETWNAATDGDATAVSTLNAVKTGAQNLQRGERECLILPQSTDSEGKPTGWGVELLKSGGQRQFDHVAIIQAAEQRIAVRWLVQFLLLGQEKSASFALSSDQTALLGFVLSGILDDLCGCLHKQLLIPLTELLGFDAALAPQMTHGPLDEPSLAQLAQFLKVAVETGTITPDDSLEGYVRSIAGLPPRSAKDEGL